MSAAPDPALADNGGTSRPFYGSVEYLMWWIKGHPVPPLMTQGDPGILGQPGVQVVLGDDLDAELRSGGRFTVGRFLGANQTWAVEGSYFFLGRQSDEQSVAADGSSELFVPFIDPTVSPPSEVAAFLAVTSGNGSVRVSSFLQGAEANIIRNITSSPTLRLSVLGGFRFLSISEEMTYSFANEFGSATDQFDTRNRFYGGQLGIRSEWSRGRFFVQATGKVALGCMDQTVEIIGTTTTTNVFGPGSITVPGGFFA